MNTLNIHKTETTAIDGTPIRLVYDQDGDILDIFFGDNESAAGIELTEHIMLRLSRGAQRAVSLMINNFSILAEQTEYGPRSYPLNKLKNLPDDLRDLVFRLVSSPPINQFVTLSSSQLPETEPVPCIFIHQQPKAA